MRPSPISSYARLDPGSEPRPGWVEIAPDVLLLVDRRATNSTPLLDPWDVPGHDDPTPEGHDRSHRTLALVATAVLVLGVVAWFGVGGDTSRADDEPTPATTDRSVLAATPDAAMPFGTESVGTVEIWPTAAADVRSALSVARDFANALTDADLDRVLAMLTDDSTCDIRASPHVESCTDTWGFWIGIGASASVERCWETRSRTVCVVDLGSDVHEMAGRPGHRVGHAFRIVGEDRVRMDAGTPSGSMFWGSESMRNRFEEQMHELYPDRIGADGLLRYDVETASMMRHAVAAMIEPAATVEHVVRSLESVSSPSPAPGRCVTQYGPVGCAPLLRFLRAIETRISLQCDQHRGNITSCTAEVETDLHAALGSPATTWGVSIIIHSGVLDFIRLDLGFTDDTATHDEFVDFLRTENPDLFSSDGRPLFAAANSDDWLTIADALIATRSG